MWTAEVETADIAEVNPGAGLECTLTTVQHYTVSRNKILRLQIILEI